MPFLDTYSAVSETRSLGYPSGGSVHAECCSHLAVESKSLETTLSHLWGNPTS